MTVGPAFKIKIVKAPIGEAPLWVREAWIGLELPLANMHEMTVEAGGVLSGPQTWWGYRWAKLRGRLHPVTGYVVRSARAIDLLSRTQPAAADWWRENAPRFCDPGEGFIFDSPCCVPSPEPVANAPWG